MSHELESSSKYAGLLLLALKEKHRLTQSPIDFAVQQIQSMVEYTLDDVKSSVEETLQHHCSSLGIPKPDIYLPLFYQPFSGLESEYMQTNFYKENFNLIVSYSKY